MLIEFRLKNYKCFKEEQVLSFVASSDDTQLENLIVPGEGFKFKLLRSVVIYGANASGKSKMLEALHFMFQFVRASVRRKTGAPINVEPFLFDKESRSLPSEFEVSFIHRGVRYQYGFSVNQKRVLGEYLYAAPKGRTVPYFQRSWNVDKNEDDYFFGASLKGQNEVVRRATREDALFLSMAVTLKHPVLSDVYQWFTKNTNLASANVVRSIQVTSRDDKVGQSIQLTLRGDEDTEENHKQLRDLLKFADLGISDFKYVDREDDLFLPSLNDSSDSGSTVQKRFRFVDVEFMHPSGEQEEISIPFAQESKGTQQLFFIARPLLRGLIEGRVFLADELDRSLHPLLVRALVQLINDPKVNKNNSQLLFTTHDVTLLEQSLFRRDQVWFAEKDTTGASYVYSLLDYSPRKGESLSKGYLQGRYGAIPFLADPTFLNKEGEGMR